MPVIFSVNGVPRTTTREEWRTYWSWRRETLKTEQEHIRTMAAALAIVPLEMKEKFVDAILDRPLFVWRG